LCLILSHQHQFCLAPSLNACKNPNIGPPWIEAWLQILLAQVPYTHSF
jgi:hypothetical protein